MQYKPGDIFLQQLMFDHMDYGICAFETTDTRDSFLIERIPPQVILGGYYYG